jgi:hypothetical protein
MEQGLKVMKTAYRAPPSLPARHCHDGLFFVVPQILLIPPAFGVICDHLEPVGLHVDSNTPASVRVRAGRMRDESRTWPLVPARSMKPARPWRSNTT